jgi:hypothetical protein
MTPVPVPQSGFDQNGPDPTGFRKSKTCLCNKKPYNVVGSDAASDDSSSALYDDLKSYTVELINIIN